MFKVGDRVLHIPTGDLTTITKVGAVTYNILRDGDQFASTVPHEDVRQQWFGEKGIGLTFSEFQRANAARCAENAGGEDDWNITDWTNAVAGEAVGDNIE